MEPYSISREIAARREAQEKFFSEVKPHWLGNFFRAQTRHIAQRLQTRTSLFIGDRLQYEPDALSFLEGKKAETDTLVLYTHSAVWFPTTQATCTAHERPSHAFTADSTFARVGRSIVPRRRTSRTGGMPPIPCASNAPGSNPRA
jgi:hypothetical protein